MIHHPAPRCACREGEVAADPQASLTARCACGCKGLPKISGMCDNPGSRLGVMLFLGTSHKSSILSCSIALSLFDFFTQFLLFGQRHSNASTMPSVLVSAKLILMISAGSSGVHGDGHRMCTSKCADGGGKSTF